MGMLYYGFPTPKVNCPVEVLNPKRNGPLLCFFDFLKVSIAFLLPHRHRDADSPDASKAAPWQSKVMAIIDNTIFIDNSLFTVFELFPDFFLPIRLFEYCVNKFF